MKKIFVFTAIISLLFLTGCADHVSFEQASKITPVGFWYGLWHGWTLPFAFIGSLFDDTISIYAVYNNGNWYNFGYLLGASTILGGCSKCV